MQHYPDKNQRIRKSSTYRQMPRRQRKPMARHFLPGRMAAFEICAVQYRHSTATRQKTRVLIESPALASATSVLDGTHQSRNRIYPHLNNTYPKQHVISACRYKRISIDAADIEPFAILAIQSIIFMVFIKPAQVAAPGPPSDWQTH